jgi:hypothetical protein
VAGLTIGFVGGYFILKGKNWARWLIVGWPALVLFFNLVTSPMRWMLIPGAFYIAALAYFLFRRDANEFFASGGANVEAQGAPSWRTIISICCYLLSGFAFTVSCMMAFLYFPEGVAVAKLLLLSFALLPAAVLLSIGRVVSEEPNWKREVGTVLVV